MRGRRGYALVLVLFVTLLCFLLGAALLQVGLGDLRVSRHMAEAMQAKYFAEAGVETVVAGLPREPTALLGYNASATRDDELCFTATAEPLPGELYAIRVRSEGRVGSKRRVVEAAVRYLPLGDYGVIAGSAHTSRVDVRGSVRCGLLWLGPGESAVAGNLHVGEMPLPLGTVDYGGYRCERHEVNAGMFDLSACLDAAGGWAVPEESGGVYRLADGAGGRWFVPGDLLVTGETFADLLAVVAGHVVVEALPAGRMVLLAAGDVTFDTVGPADVMDGQQLVVIGGGWIRGSGLALRGVLAAPEVDLADMVVHYCDRAVIPWLEYVPQALLLDCGSFVVEWVETEVRR